MNPIDQLVDEFASRIISGEMEFDQMRKVMTGRNIDDQTIRMVISAVDDIVRGEELHRSAVDQKKRMQLYGMGLVAFGVGFSVLSFLGVFDSTYTGVQVFMYGPVFSGVSILLYGKFKKEKPYESVRNRRKFMSKRGL